jgi:hypothetical protein
MISFSDCVNLVEPLKIHAVSVHILYNKGKIEKYCPIIARSRKISCQRVFLTRQDKNRDELFNLNCEKFFINMYKGQVSIILIDERQKLRSNKNCNHVPETSR